MPIIKNYNSILTSSEMTSPACNYSQEEITFQEISFEAFLRVPDFQNNVFSEVTDAELIFTKERMGIFQRIFYEGQEVSVEQLIGEKLENTDWERNGFLLNRVFVIIEGDSKVLCIQPYLPSFGVFNRIGINQNPEVYELNDSVDIDNLTSFISTNLGSPSNFTYTLNNVIEFTFQSLEATDFKTIYTDLVRRSERIDTVLNTDPIGNLFFNVVKLRDEFDVNIYLGINSD